tara:strand:+ start:1222 stop:1617 length:396 start_codon:yes stop_codon:yes gene_type:complete
MDKVIRRKIIECLGRAACRDEPWPIEVDVWYVYQIGVKQNWKCAIKGVPLEFVNNGKYWRGKKCNREVMTIDRIDSTKGYVKGNVQLLCCEANVWKADFSHDQLMQYCFDYILSNYTNKIKNFFSGRNFVV